MSFFLEALVVGFLVYKTKIKDYVIADILFWLFVGFPVVFFCYKNVLSLETSVVQIIALKQTVNGVVNTVISVLPIYSPTKLQTLLSTITSSMC